jgi:hypothetical protein
MARELNKEDKWLERLLKLIPSEIVAVYLALLGIFELASENLTKLIVQSVVFVILFFFIFIHYKQFLGFRYAKIDQTTNEKVANWDTIKQVSISAVSFVVWVYTIGGPFRSITWVTENLWVGTVILILWTFSTQYIAKVKE